tara:strand:+ start:150 stop:533 length:384 start_codon:yes stop_codon:yes gene_type:complete
VIAGRILTATGLERQTDCPASLLPNSLSDEREKANINDLPHWNSRQRTSAHPHILPIGKNYDRLPPAEGHSSRSVRKIVIEDDSQFGAVVAATGNSQAKTWISRSITKTGWSRRSGEIEKRTTEIKA